MRLLVLKKDRVAAEILSENFSGKENYIFGAQKTKEIFLKIKKEKFDAVILDLFIYDKNALDTIQGIRKISDIPILMLVAALNIKDIVNALDNGIDDCLKKPFSPAELKARIANLVKRRENMVFKNTKIIAGSLEVDVKKHTVKAGGKQVDLTKTEYKILLYLMLNKNHLINKRELTEHLFKNRHYKSMHLLNMHIYNLRKKLGKTLVMQTVPYQGFVIKE
jgi:DNA-binding response OmpR family regulator